MRKAGIPSGPLLMVLGFLAPPLHITSISISDWLSPTTSPLSNAVSDLGRSGEPYRTLVNYGGLVTPGLLVAACGLSVGIRRGLPRMTRAGNWLLLASGVSLAIAGARPFPATEHLVAMLAVGACAAAGVTVLALSAHSTFSRGSWLVTGIACSFLTATNLVLWIVEVSDPVGVQFNYLGFLQRSSGFGTFVWYGAWIVEVARRHHKD